MRSDELERLAALHTYHLLDEPADDELAAVVRVAAAVAGVPTATLNLLAEDRQCQLTTVGFAGGDSPREESLCAVSVGAGRFTHVPDASRDPRYADNVWVTGTRGAIRFYAAAPLVTAEGHALGTLCVFSDTPQHLTDEQIARLEDLAGVVLALFERRRQARVNAALAAAAQQQRAVVARAHGELEKRSSELEQSNADLQQFASVASHDLGSPLTVIGGYLELLEDEYAPDLDAAARGYLAAAQRGVFRMKGLLEAVLGYARSGSGPSERRLTDLSEVVDAATADLAGLLDGAGATVTGSDLPELWCDPVLVRQLLQNLITNAVTYRHPDRPCVVRVTAEGSGEGWRLSVIDNGIGIPPEHRETVFGMFTRVNPGDRKGHGIGLATCQRVVARHGGRIWADAAPDGGTAMRFTLPQRSATRSE